MTTDINELAKSLKAAAEKYKSVWGIARYSKTVEAREKFHELVTPANVIALVEALEKAKGMETYWKTQCRGITDHCEELQARIAELESHTVKPPVHPTVASENLDDETLQELIEFRRTTFEYHSKEGNKVQTIIHGVTLAALRELQERRKADSEPVAEVVSIYGDPEAFGEREIRPLVGIQQMPYGTKLYRHAQPAPVVSTDLFHTAALAIEDLLTTKDRAGAGVWFDLPFRLRSAANAQPAPVVPQDVLEALQKVARIRLDLNEFDGDRRGIADCLCDAEETLIEVVNRRAAMLADAPQSPGSEPATAPGKWIPVSERMPDDDDFVYIWPRPDFGVELHVGQYCECSPKGDGWYAQVYEQNYGIEWHPITVTHWMPLPAAPQEPKP